MTSMIPTARYRPVVRIGNWFEDICLEQVCGDSYNKEIREVFLFIFYQ